MKYMVRLLMPVSLLVSFWVAAQTPTLPPHVSLPAPAQAYAGITQKFQDYVVILRPDEDKPEWWAGAPSVEVGEDGAVWLACRMRTAESTRGQRGYEIRILRSDDGVHFEKALSIRREDVPIPGFERPSLLRDPKTDQFKLYACGPWKEGPWGIIKFDDAMSPEQFAAKTARLVLGPQERAYERDVAPVEFKDPVILYAENAYHCYVIGYMRKNERIYHFSSADGETWEPVGNPYNSIMPLSGWHDFFVRPSSVLPIGVGYLFIYEGSKTDWYDPVYNVATGLAYTFDMHTMIDLTPDAPLLVSGTPNETFATFRYSDWIMRNGEVWVYAEVACPDQTHEVRLYRTNIQ